MNTLINFCRELTYHRFEVTVIPQKNIEIEGWLGAVIRNNLLFAAEQVITRDGFSLLSLINTLPVSEEHPLYKPLSGGFPKGFVISLVSPDKYYTSPVLLRAGKEFTFSLTLMGKYVEYYSDFIQAIRVMCETGIMHRWGSFCLKEICETDCWGRRHVVCIGHSDRLAALRCPVRFENFEDERFGKVERMIRLVFRSPVLLAVPVEKMDKTISFQDKLNGFPSFYQFIRSAAYRSVKLAALYACPQDIVAYQMADELLNEFTAEAASALLIQSNLDWVSMLGPFRSGDRPRIQLKGYIGELVFSGNFSKYIPLLQFMQGLSIGNDTIYGLGNFQVEVLKLV